MTVSPTPSPAPVAPAGPSFWKRALAKAQAVARNPILRPIEIWALRAALAFLVAKLGLDISGQKL